MKWTEFQDFIEVQEESSKVHIEFLDNLSLIESIQMTKFKNDEESRDECSRIGIKLGDSYDPDDSVYDQTY